MTAGRTVVVTGASSGIGRAAAVHFGRSGAAVVLVGRDRARLDQAAALVGRADTYVADFAELDQVRALATWLAATYDRIEVLCNNAGGIWMRRTTTVDGHELTMQVNHLAPFLLTNLLRDRLRGGRVITTSSAVHPRGGLDPADLDGARVRYRPLDAYGRSKLANILFAAGAAARWPDIMSVAYHPGGVRTRVARDSRIASAYYRLARGMLTPEQGADTMLWLADEPVVELEPGGYYVHRRRREPRPAGVVDALATPVWRASEAAVDLDAGHVP